MASGLRWTEDEYKAFCARGNVVVTTRKVAGPRVAAPDVFLDVLTRLGMPAPLTECVFLADRKFRADYAWPDRKVIVEKQGYRDHSTKKGLRRDYEKSNLAQAAGWRYLQSTPKGLTSPAFLALLRRVLVGVE